MKKETSSFAAREILLAFQTNKAGFRVFNILPLLTSPFLLFNCGCRRQRLVLRIFLRCYILSAAVISLAK